MPSPSVPPTASPSPTVPPKPTPPIPKPGITPLPAYAITCAPSDKGLPNNKATVDGKGVVMIDYGAPLGKQYSPTGVAQGAICYYNVWLAEKDAAKKTADWTAFMIQIDWLVKNQTKDGRWLFNFKWGSQPIPWWSALAEGVAVSGLVRAYALTEDPAYKAAAVSALTTFTRDRNTAHGVMRPFVIATKTYYVYDEYLLGFASGHVLNGWMFSLIGLYEAETYLHDPTAKAALRGSDRGLAALKAFLPSFDTGNWTRYSTTPTSPHTGLRSSLNYHKIVIAQLRVMATISGDKVFTQWANKWQGYLDACHAAGHCPPPRLPWKGP